jgi:hypothetical protein
MLIAIMKEFRPKCEIFFTRHRRQYNHFASSGEINCDEKVVVGRKIFHKEFVSASGDSFAALSRNEAKYVPFHSV